MTTDRSNSRKPRLLVLTSMFPRWRGDSEPGFVFELCRRLTDKFEVRVLAPHASGAATAATMDEVEVIRYRYAFDKLQTLAYGGGIVPKLRKQPWKWFLVPFFLLAQYRTLRGQLKRWRPDAIHSHWIIPQGLIAALACGGRKSPVLITTSHGTDMFAFNGRWLQCIKRYTLGRSDVTTVVSSMMRDFAGTLGCDIRKIHVEPMGVDLQYRFTPDPNAMRSRNRILFVGRLAETKGLRFLLDAAPQIFARHADASIAIVGFGPEEAALRAQARSLGITDHVEFVGPLSQSELPDFYRRAAVFVAPFVKAKSGEQEGFGLVIVEAIGCGCPVVASALPGLHDVIGEQVACIMEAGNANALAEAVIRVLDAPDSAAAIGNELRNDVLVRFDWAAVAMRYAHIIENAIDLKEKSQGAAR